MDVLAETLPLPPVIRIEPAGACNLRCSHCPTGMTLTPRYVMNDSTFARALDDMVDNMPPFRAAVMYHGGEPLLNRRFLRMVRAVKSAGMPFVKTVSNGMLLTDALAIGLVDSGLDAIEISLDGDSEAMSNAVRVRSDFGQIVAAVRHLDRVNRIAGSPLKIDISTTQFQQRETYDPEAPAPVPDHLHTAFEGCDVSFKSTWAVQWPTSWPDEYDRLVGPTPPPATSCSLLTDTVTVRANGDVVPCCYDLASTAVVGNVNDMRLTDIWNGPTFRDFRRRFAAGDYPDLCSGCAVVTGPRYLVPKTRRLIPLTVA